MGDSISDAKEESSVEIRDIPSSDQESDTFEDATETASVRSLTKRPPPTRPLTQTATSPKIGTSSELEMAFKKVRGRTATIAASDDKDDKRKSSADAAVKEVEKAEEEQEEAQDMAEVDIPHVNGAAVRKSSALPDIDLSNNTDLDNVSLDDDTISDIKPLSAGIDTPPAVPEKETAPSKTLSLSSITSVLPSIPWSPSTAATDAPSKPFPVSPSMAPIGAPAAAPTRKLTSPFAWLSRSSREVPAISPPATGSVSPRRNTVSSVTTLTSNPEMMLSKLEEEESSQRGTGRNSLKDRFKMIRLREEAGLQGVVGVAAAGSDDETAGAAASSSRGGSPRRESSPTGKTSNSRLSVPIGSGSGSGDDQAPPSSPMLSPNPSLAPGTVSGVMAGPSSIADTTVDWDLWQSVIYEGPAAVARTSAEELNKAIATGIPNAIRGVIWQVLAQSKNEELEVVYRELVVRGTDKEKERQSGSGSSSSQKEGTTSAASSVHSGESSGASGLSNGTTASRTSVTTTLTSATAATGENTAQQKKKAKEDAAALQKLERAIRRDLGTRTSYSKFAAAQGLQEGLFGVCKAYALFDEAVGYAQGMNFLIMPLLFNMPEEEAFCLLVRLMNKYQLRDLFVQDMPGLHMHLYLFERLLEDLEPALYCHLHRRGISPHLYATQWFLTLFAYRFPLQLVLRIYDLILSEGLVAILKFGIVLMQKNAATLLGMSDMGQLTTYLKDRLFDVYIDASPSAGSILENGFFGSSSSSLDKEVYRADQFVRDACEVKLTPELVKAYRAEWEEKTRAEREREAELEHLRATNASLALKVRRFEERIEMVDQEQTALATELVRTKVENEELQDANESLRGQVRELKVVIERQPEDLEKAWLAERDSLMARNSKVHEENLRVEKEMTELEEELVQTKMRYAEINSQYESLSRKWAELKRQFKD